MKRYSAGNSLPTLLYKRSTNFYAMPSKELDEYQYVIFPTKIRKKTRSIMTKFYL